MSVVNKMLRDLESRQHPVQTSANYVPPTHVKSLWLVLLICITVVLSIVITSYMYVSDTAQQPPQESQPNEYKPNKIDQIAKLSDSESSPQYRALDSQVNGQVNDIREESIPARQVNSNPKVAINSSLANADVDISNNHEDVFEPVNLSASPIARQVFEISPSDGAQTTLSHLRAQAHLASQRGDDIGVINNLQEIIKLAPEDLRTRKQLAALLFSKNQLQSAKQVLLQALDQAPADSSSRLMLSRVYFRTGDNTAALDVLKGHPSNDLANDELLSFRAALAEKTGDYTVSQNDYQLLVQRNPREAKWWLGLGVSQDKQMLSIQAIASYEQAQALNQLPQQVNAFVQERIRLLTRRS